MSILSTLGALIFGDEPEAPAATSSPSDPDAAERIRKWLEFEISQRKLEEDQYRCVNLMEDPND